MLGYEIADPDSVEEGGRIRGMELLPVRTVLQKEKHRCQIDGKLEAVEGIFAGLTGYEFTGYEIHMGETVSTGCVYGSYIHGLFDKGEIAGHMIQTLAREKGIILEGGVWEDYSTIKERQYDQLADTLREYLQKNGITTCPYEAFYEYVKTLENQTILLNRAVVNTKICNNLPESAQMIDAEDPTLEMKAVKNETEISNTRKAHVKDAVAMCRFMYWLKKNVGKIPMTEISASDYLESLRREQEGLLDLSFDTICGYADHGAIVHYAATPESDVPLKPEGLLLVDSGGHYLEGTTDITRTFALGPVTEEMKADFTRVCRSNMNLANARFLYGCSGMNLDIIAREPFWEAGLDFKHGTGHGVGYVLNVHEGPNAFRYKGTEDRPGGAVFEEGMVTTDEPGIYIEGKYGIRLENELVCQKGEKNEYGQFMYFENLTYVPFDLDAIDPKQMTEVEKKRLNDYHANVYKVVSPYLQGEELAWLKEATRAI